MPKVKVKLNADKRLMVMEPEFAAVLKILQRDGNTLSAIIRQAWDSGKLRVLNKNSPVKATDAHISIVGHITRDEMRRYLTNTEMGNGFANRFLFLCIQRSKLLPEGGNTSSINCEPIPSLSEGKDGLVGAVTARSEAQVVRLALLYALLDCSPVIRIEHLKAALSLWKYCKDSASYIFGEAVGEPIADTLLVELQKHPQGLTRTEIRDFFQKHKRGKEIDYALSVLKEKGLAECNYEDTDGRRVERWYATKAT